MNQLKQMMQQAQKLQAQMMGVKEKIDGMTVEGAAGGGLVKVTVDGTKTTTQVVIDPSLLQPSEKEVLEDLLVAASRDACHKMASLEKEEMEKVTGGMMGGMPFPKF